MLVFFTKYGFSLFLKDWFSGLPVYGSLFGGLSWPVGSQAAMSVPGAIALSVCAPCELAERLLPLSKRNEDSALEGYRADPQELITAKNV